METVEQFNKTISDIMGLNISVITVCANLNSRININLFPDIKKFNNCFIFKLTHNESTNISVKVFVNGKIQITGCKTIETAHTVPVSVHDTLLNYKHYIENLETYHLSDIKIGMINSNFRLNFKLNLVELQDFITSNTSDYSLFQYSSYQPDKYCGINLKCHKNISIFIFGSGAINITGAKNSIDLKEAYDSINELIKKKIAVMQ